MLTSSSQKQVEQFQNEIEGMKKSKGMLIQQWESAIQAMQQRDTAMKELAEEHSKVVDLFKFEKEKNKKLNNLLEEEENKREGAEKSADQGKGRTAYLQSQVRELQMENENINKKLKLYKSQLEASESLIAAKIKSEESLLEQVDGYKNKINNLNIELNNLNKQLFNLQNDIHQKEVNLLTVGLYIIIIFYLLFMIGFIIYLIIFTIAYIFY